MRKKVAKQIGRAARAVGKTVGKRKGKAGIAAAGVVLVAGAIMLAKKKRTAKRARNAAQNLAATSVEDDAIEAADSAEAAMHIPVARDADTASEEGGSETRATTRRGRMTAAPVAGARFNGVRNDRKETRD